MDYTLLSCIDSRVESPMKFYGRFELGPFAPGQGLTVANSLRRSLLSQLTGTAIPLVEISGASHEYETLTGVRESVLDIILNIKQIILTSDFEFFSPQVGFLSVKGPGIIRARDLKLPDFIYAVDANQHIATLTTNGNLNMKFIIACGKNHITHSPGTIQYTDWVHLLKKTSPLPNIIEPSSNSTSIESSNSEKKSRTNEYVSPPSAFYQQWKNERLLSSELKNLGKDTNKKVLSKTDLSSPMNKSEQQDSTMFLSANHKIGYFTIDATFMPVTRVNYLIQASDDLQLAKDYIILEVWTNGSIHPRHAIHKAAKALIQLFLPLQQMKNTGLNLNGQVQLKYREEQDANFTSKKNLMNPIFTKDRSTTHSLTLNQKSNTVVTKQNYQSDPRILNLDIGNLDLTLAPYSLLKQANINTINDLVSYSKQQILEIPNFGQRWLNQIEDALVDLNLKLNQD